jgi:hypothetical protein
MEAPGWLAEHLDHGFPRPDDLRAGLAGFGDVRLIPNESVRTHERLMRVETRRPGHAASAGLARGVRALVRRRGRPTALLSWAAWILRGRDRPPTYRHIAVADRRGDAT